MSDSNYKEVPVETAKQIALDCSKDVVVIVAWDETSHMLHTTTYGRTERYKHPAAQLGEILAEASGCDLRKTVNFEDFRHRTEAEWASEREALIAPFLPNVLDNLPPFDVPIEWIERSGVIVRGKFLKRDWASPGIWVRDGCDDEHRQKGLPLSWRLAWIKNESEGHRDA